MLYRCLALAKNRHFWVVVALFAASIVLHYPQQLLGINSPSLFSFLGLSRHAVERIFLLLPVSYAGYYLGNIAGLFSLDLAAAIMLPRVFFISEYFPDALFETIIVFIIGLLINLWFIYDRQERKHKQQILSDLDQANRQLMAHSKALERSHQQLKESQAQVIQAEKLKSLGQLAASIAHEVNNPLSGVLVYIQLLTRKIARHESDDQVTLDYLTKIEAELIRSTKLVQNLLNFSRESPLELQQVNLNSVVNRAFDLVSQAAKKQNVRVFNELDPSLPEISADANQIQQVCINLMLNAIQAMQLGGRLTLHTYAQDAQVKLEVKDTGIGIPPENIGKIFTPFFSTKPEIKGVGLGLAVAYGIVQRHNGKIEVTSRPGEGTVFTVSLPIAP
jgi:signal transduction histidine kinase